MAELFKKYIGLMVLRLRSLRVSANHLGP